MVARFKTESFLFAEGDAVPEHVDTWPDESERDPAKFWVQGEDTFAGEYYPLAIDVDDMPTARLLEAARLRALERTQPTDSSGGQSVDGIQDRVHIRLPDVTK